MLKLVGGAPPRQVLVLGLSFRNLDIFQKDPDSYIRINHEETGLPMDVMLSSGSNLTGVGRARDGDVELFMIQLSRDDLLKLRRRPGKYHMDFNMDIYKIPMNICIFSGETEASMAHDCTELIGPQTRVTTSPRLRN